MTRYRICIDNHVLEYDTTKEIENVDLTVIRVGENLNYDG